MEYKLLREKYAKFMTCIVIFLKISFSILE